MKKYAVIAFLLLAFKSVDAGPTDAWRIDKRSASGPMVQLDLLDANSKRRTVFVVFEYARQCDPIFSYVEISGNSLGSPTGQALLKDSKIGVILNGYFYTWHAAKTTYTNGYEAGFGVPNELLSRLLSNIESLTFVTPIGEKITLTPKNFQPSLKAAIEVCRNH